MSTRLNTDALSLLTNLVIHRGIIGKGFIVVFRIPSNSKAQSVADRMKILKLILSTIAAWALGLAFIATTLYFTNDGADFTVTDLIGFGTLAIAASGVLMLALYLPSLYWLRRRSGGVQKRIEFLMLTGLLCNLPVFVILLSLINRKMVLTEALGFMATFLIIGAVFGLGFTWVQSEAT